MYTFVGQKWYAGVALYTADMSWWLDIHAKTVLRLVGISFWNLGETSEIKILMFESYLSLYAIGNHQSTCDYHGIKN